MIQRYSCLTLDLNKTLEVKTYQNAFSSGISNNNKPAKKFIACIEKKEESMCGINATMLNYKDREN